jgi:hypothetical protein
VSAHLCSYCGALAEGDHSIHRDGFCEGPEVDLCNAHGSGAYPSLSLIWERIAERLARGETMTEVEP